MTYLMLTVMVGAIVFHLLGSINVVGVELISFALGGAWFVLFVKNVELLVGRLAAFQGPLANSTDIAPSTHPD